MQTEDRLAAARARIEERLRERQAGGTTGEIRPRGTDAPAPLSLAQRRLWFLHGMDPVGAGYNMFSAFRLAGALDAAALHRALEALVRRHAALRTAFREEGGEPVQQAVWPVQVPLPSADLSHLPADAREAEVRRLAREEAHAPFDLGAPPLVRFRLLRLGAEEHALFIALHHVAGDGWSLGVMLRELDALYAAFAAGAGDPLPAPALQYADYAAWQHEPAQQATAQRHLAWWTEHLAGAPTVLELAADRPRPAAPTFRGGETSLRLGAELLERVRALGREEGATPFMAGLAAFAAVLARHAGQDQVLVGTPVAGRARRELEPLVGFFVNTLALRADVSGQPTFRELLRRVRANTLAAFDRQEVPFERVVESLAPERSLSRHPLFQVMLTWQAAARADASAAPAGALRAAPLSTGADVEKFDLSLTFSEGPDGLGATLRYAEDLFEPATAARLLDHVAGLLRAAVDQPDARVDALPLASEPERALLRAWSGTAPALPRTASIPAAFAAVAAASPQRVAVQMGGESLTYGELDAQANRIAHRLLRMGVRPDDRVAFCLEREPWMVAAILGILKAGGAYLPLDPAHPAERLAFMLADAGAPVVITRDHLADRLPADGPAVLRLDDGLQGEPETDPGVEISADHLAYVVYTSGSTGTPKGVEVPHRAVLRLVQETDYIQFGPEQVFLQLAPIAFDASTLELWGALLHGARLVLYPGAQPTLDELGRTLREGGVTTLWLTAGLFHLMVDERLADLGGVRQLLAGGDVLSRPHVRKVLQAHPSLRLVNGYGPTENTTFTTTHTIRVEDTERPSIPIGRAIAGTRVHVLDLALRACPIGVPGELYTGGQGLARGYLARPELTAERFVEVPVEGARERLYRTGDRVRWLEDGTLEFLGRMDQQVKVRGFRIELGEVEARLCAHPGVREAVAATREHGPGDRRLAAWYVPVDGAVPAAELRAHLKAALPDYMVPSDLVPMDALPLNANGKVDRAALPAPESGADEDGYTAPRTATEEVVAEIWADVLRVERAGVHDDFFALGGHSLLATRVVSRIREAFGAELPLRALFEAPALGDFARRVDEARHAPAAALPPVAAGPRPERIPLSFAQERLWYLDQLEPGSSLFNVPRVLRTRGTLNVDALGAALGEIVRRHEALRTVVRTDDGRPVQVVGAPAPFDIDVIDLSALPREERDEAARRAAADEAAAPFELARGPLLRVRVLRLEDDEHLLLITLHHVVTDGWSTGIFFRELAVLYSAFAAGEPSPLPELPLQYADYAVWQRTQLQGEALDTQLAWWKTKMAGAPGLLELPTDRPRPPVASHAGARERVAFPTELLESLRALSRREGTTLFMTLLGAFKVLLSRYAGQQDVVVGTSIAGRTRAELEGLIGLFFNTLVLRTDLSGDPTFRELLGRVRETTLGAYDHQDVPFEKLVDALQPERTLRYTPLFQVLFELHNTPAASGSLTGLRLEGVPAESSSAKHDITLALGEGPDGLAGTLEYSTDLFDASTIRRLIGHYQALLEAVAADAAAPISTLPLLTSGEREEMEGWNPAPRAFPADRCIHHLLEEQAARTPDAVAVEWQGGRMTFAELDTRATRLARHLRRLGVGPEVKAGILTERSPEMIVGIFGILKAGGAYVPLDHTHPADRIGYTLRDSGARVLLTQDRLVDSVPEHACTVVRLDADWPVIEQEPAERMETGVTAENLAYVYYTSGSTGRPKGVLMHHRGVVNYIHWGCEYYGAASGTGAPVFSSIAVDLTLTNFLPLFVGKRIVLVPEGPGLDALAELLKSRPGFSHIKITPTHLALLTPLLTAEEARAAANTLVIGADNLLAEPTLFWQDAAPSVRLLNEYGPTETVVGCAIYDVSAAAPRSGPVSIGRTIDNLVWYVLDERMQPVPAGVPGELYIGGIGVARGYLNRPGLTAEKFIPDPFSNETGAHLYRTGDRARWLAGGKMEFLGRTDFQVKIRGYRVETGEIESVLMSHPRVSKALAIIREDVPGEPRLVGYIVPVQGEEAPSVTELRALLKERVPEYMIPGAFVTLTEADVPTTGKITPAQLPAPTGDRGRLGRDYVAPRDEVEQALAQAWADVLRLERVGVEDNFFELGGDSILSIQVIARAARAGIRVTARQLFQLQTVAALARVAERAQAAQTDQGPVVGPVPLSPMLHWFFDQDFADAHHYNHATLLAPTQPVDAETLQRAVDALVEHHDALRMRFRRVDGAWTAESAAPGDPVPVEVVDLSAVPRDDEPAAIAAAAAERQGALDLERGPIVRAVLMRLSAGRQRVLLVIHHLAVDGVSWRILLDDLETAYAQAAAGEAVSLPPRSTSFRAWSARLAELASSPELRDELPYWERTAAALPPLPRDGEGENTVASQRTVTASLDEDETRALLQEVPTAWHTEVNDALLAALARAMEPWTGQRALLIDLEGHGREGPWDDIDLSRTVGWFTSVHPVRLETSGVRDPGEALKAVKEQLRAVPGRGIGYGILRWLGDADASARLAALPAVEVSFNYLGQFDGALPADGRFAPAREGKGPSVSPRQRRAYAIDVVGVVSGGRLTMTWMYSQALHRPETVQALSARYLDALRELVDHCRTSGGGGYTPSDFPEAQLSQDELDDLLAELS